VAFVRPMATCSCLLALPPPHTPRPLSHTLHCCSTTISEYC